MEVVEIISHHVDKTQNIIVVEFRTSVDDEDVVREDFIEYSYFEEFGFDTKDAFDIFEGSDFDDDDEWEDDDYEYVDEDKLISFLNEYYIVFPKKIPRGDFR
jgi:hypothetical protein